MAMSCENLFTFLNSSAWANFSRIFSLLKFNCWARSNFCKRGGGRRAGCFFKSPSGTCKISEATYFLQTEISRENFCSAKIISKKCLRRLQVNQTPRRKKLTSKVKPPLLALALGPSNPSALKESSTFPSSGLGFPSSSC